MSLDNNGTLFVIATPIGNLDDWSYRAVEIVKKLNLLAAEDTRHIRTLLSKYNIKVKLTSLHAHNEKAKAVELISKLKDGGDVGIVSDAGTPLINDPGFSLVKIAHEEGIKVSSIPGPCAAITALSASGIPTDKFSYQGFLPSKSAERLSVLRSLADIDSTLIFYEAPSRIIKSISDICVAFGEERKVCVARELTKMFETIKSGTAIQIKEFIESDANQQKGEFVLIVEGAKEEKDNKEISDEHKKLVKMLVNKYSVKDAVSIVRELSSAPKSVIYEYALSC